MSNKKVTLTLVDLDITQLSKIRGCLANELCNRNSVRGAYLYELAELVDSLLDAGRSNIETIKAPELTIY
jgi:hypothetical protein